MGCFFDYFLVFDEKICYSGYMNEINPISSTEKHNAMISYCFLGPLMLLSRQDQFKSDFIRSHAKYASLLTLCFLILIVFLVRSQNFSSLLMFDALQFQASWNHILLFILFGWVLLATFWGIINAMRWVKPQLWVNFWGIDNFIIKTSDQNIGEKEKIPVIISHIPFLGIYLSDKYNGNLIFGARWWSWCFIIAALFIWLDSSFFLLVTWIILCTLWIVYQSVRLLSENNIHLLGEKLPSADDVHIFLKSVFKYSRKLLNHDNILPVWSDIFSQEKTNYTAPAEIVLSPLLSIPFINTIIIFSLWKKHQINNAALQGIFITLLIIFAMIAGSTSGIMILILASFFGFSQIHFYQKLNIPFLSEIALICIMLHNWRTKKSIIQEETHTL